MNPYILIGIDLLFTAGLVVLAMAFVRNRVRFYLEAQPAGPRGAVPEERPSEQSGKGGKTVSKRAPTGDVGQGGWDGGSVTRQAESLKRQGFSAEAIAQKLQTSTGEIEMLLALSEMGRRNKGVDPGGSFLDSPSKMATGLS